MSQSSTSGLGNIRFLSTHFLISFSRNDWFEFHPNWDRRLSIKPMQPIIGRSSRIASSGSHSCDRELREGRTTLSHQCRAAAANINHRNRRFYKRWQSPDPAAGAVDFEVVKLISSVAPSPTTFTSSPARLSGKACQEPYVSPDARKALGPIRTSPINRHR